MQPHGLGFHQIGDVLDFIAGDDAGAVAQRLGFHHALAHTLLQESGNGVAAEHGDDGRPAHAVHAFALGQNALHLVGHGLRGCAVAAHFGRGFAEDFGFDRIQLIGRDQECQGQGDLQDLVGGFLDLAQAFEESDGAVIVFDADPEQG